MKRYIKTATISDINNSDPEELLKILKNPRTRARNIEIIYNNYIASKNMYYIEDMLEALVRNPNTSAEILELARQKASGYRNISRIIAENPKISLEGLKEYADASDSIIRKAVAKNPTTPPKLLKRLSKDYEALVRTEVAKNPNTPLDVLVKLTSDVNWYVREGVGKNPNATVEIWETLANDENDKVSRTAKYHLANG